MAEEKGPWPLCLSHGPWITARPLDVTAPDVLIQAASHELRGPLNGLGLVFHLVERQVNAAQPVLPTTFQRGRRLMARLTRVLDEFSELSRLQEGRFELMAQTVDLMRLVRDAVGGLDGARREDVRLQLPNLDLLPCRGDRGRLLQALGHLLDNAVEYTPEGTPITLTLRVMAEGAEISVQDEGPGLDPDALVASLGRVRPRPGHTGLGVGLYVTAVVVAHHGGKLLLDRSMPTGLRVTLRLPLSGMVDT